MRASKKMVKPKELSHKMIKHYCFDLDGTLTDPSLGITSAVVYALNKWGIKVADQRTLTCFIGPPLYESFEKYYGFSHEEAAQSVDWFREYYKDRGIFENALFPGIPELLGAIKHQGKKVVLATSKPEVFAERILEHFDIAGYFDCVAGGLLDESRVEKADVLRYAIEKSGFIVPEESVMIGDRCHDIIGGHVVGMETLGVLYGFGSRSELEEAGANHLVDSIVDLKDFCLGSANQV